MIVYRGGTGHNKSLKYQIGVRSGTSLSYGSAAEFQATEGSLSEELVELFASCIRQSS